MGISFRCLYIYPALAATVCVYILMWTSIDNYVKEHHLIEKGDRVLLGLSGGADSVCLAMYLLSLRDRGLIRLLAIHIDHGLRGEESVRDREFVEKFCKERGIRLLVEAYDVRVFAADRQLSLEEAGREIRYRAFDQAAFRENCTKIAVAHHRGDQAETVLFHQIRGSGAAGLAGMAPLTGIIIRPLLNTGREKILSILSGQGQEYCEDSTNESTLYDRNYIRHRILPRMKEVNPAAEEHIAQLADQIRQMLKYMEPGLAEAYKAFTSSDEDGSYILLCRELSGREPFERDELIKRALYNLSGHKKDISRVHIRTVGSLLYNKVGKRNPLPYGILAVRVKKGVLLISGTEDARTKAAKDFRDELILSEAGRPGEENLKMPDPAALLLPGDRGLSLHYQTEEIEVSVSVGRAGERDESKTDCDICLDYDKIEKDVVFRHRHPGDYFIMNDQGQKKRLKRYYIDEKVPAGQRSRRLLLTQDAHVLWIEGGRISHPFKVTEKTENILCISIRKKGE